MRWLKPVPISRLLKGRTLTATLTELILYDSISLQYLSLSFYFWLETKRRDDAFGIGGVNLKWWRLLKGPTSPSNNITFICQSSLRHNIA